jgi:hypothetical protein
LLSVRLDSRPPLAMLAVMLPFALMVALVAWQRHIQIGASLLVIAFGIFWLVNPRHPRALARIRDGRCELMLRASATLLHHFRILGAQVCQVGSGVHLLSGYSSDKFIRVELAPVSIEIVSQPRK